MGKIPDFMNKTNQQMIQNMPKQQEIAAAYKRHEPEFMKEIHQIMCDGKNTAEVCTKQPNKKSRKK